MSKKIFIFLILFIIVIIAEIIFYPKVFKIKARIEIKNNQEIVIYFNQPMIKKSVKTEIYPEISGDYIWHNRNQELHIIANNLGLNSDYKIILSNGRSAILTALKNEEFSVHTSSFVDLYFEDEERIIQKLPESRQTQKRIEIDISDQKLYAWQDNKIVGEHIISTGKPKTPTKTGEFSVLSKHETAYGCGDGQCWKMPYWLGIYMVGSTENGIHELPFIKTAGGWFREGAGSLGRAVSHGCVRLSLDEAKIAWDWADIGTPVIIRR